MDPVSLIVAALVAGATTGLGEAASSAVKDAYGALRSKLGSLFADKPAAQTVLAEHEADPETYAAPMAKQLEVSGAGRDAEVVKLAKAVMAKADPEGTAAGKYEVSSIGSIGSIKADRGGIAAASIHGGATAGYQQPPGSPQPGQD